MKKLYPCLLCWLCMLFLTRCSTASDFVDYLLGEGQLELNLVTVTGLPLTAGERLVVTVADLRLDGVSVPNFRRKTYGWGAGSQDATTLYSGKIASGDYELIELVLDPGTDDRASGPGCYVLDTQGGKQQLRLAAGGVLQVPAQALTVARNGYVRGAVTFDLGQALQAQYAAGERSFHLQANRWNRRWASYTGHDPIQVDIHREVRNVGAPIVE